MGRKSLAGLMLISIVWGGGSALGQDDWGKWISPQMGKLKLDARYDTDSYFNTNVSKNRSRLHMTEHDLRIDLPLWQDDRQELALNTRVGITHFDGELTFPDTWDHFPDELYELWLGATYRRLLDNGWIVGGNLTIGSPSDKPFASLEEVAVIATGFLRIPDGERNAWLFMLNYANNREFCRHVPIPGVAYLHHPDEALRLLLGVPYSSVAWRPFDPLQLEASYMIPRGVHAQASYDLIESLTLYTGFDWRNERWFRHDRKDDDDRLFYYEKRVKVGIDWQIAEGIAVDIGGGYAFDRFFFEAERYDGRNHNRLNLSDGPFLAATIRFTF